MKLKSSLAALTLASIGVLGMSGTAFADKFDENATPPNIYDGAEISVEFDANRDIAIANSGPYDEPWLEYKGVLGIAFKDHTASSSGAGSVKSTQATNGPYRACVDYGTDFGNGTKTLCTGWIDGK